MTVTLANPPTSPLGPNFSTDTRTASGRQRAICRAVLNYLRYGTSCASSTNRRLTVSSNCRAVKTRAVIFHASSCTRCIVLPDWGGGEARCCRLETVNGQKWLAPTRYRRTYINSASGAFLSVANSWRAQCRTRAYIRFGCRMQIVWAASNSPHGHVDVLALRAAVATLSPAPSRVWSR